MKLLLIILFSSVIIDNCSTKIFEVRTIEARLDKINIVQREGYKDQLGFYFKGEGLEFYELHPLEDSNNYHVGHIYLMRIMK